MKILFIGTVEFSKKALEKIIENNANVVGVITKEKSNFNSDFSDLTPICTENNIPYFYTRNINDDETFNWIKDKNPDVIFCFGWSSLIKSHLLKLTPMGVVGFHPAALPKNRGRHPIIWALALGLEETASTFFFMDEGADSGDILSQKTIQIKSDDYAKDLYKKIIATALEQIEEFLPQLSNNTYKRTKQSNRMANYWRKRGKMDGVIDFRMSSEAIYNLVRALSKPYVGAHIEHNKTDIKIWSVKKEEFFEKNIEPGYVIDTENGVLVKTYDGAIRLINHEFDKLPKVGSYL